VADISDVSGKALALFGAIQGASYQHQTTAGVWQAMRSAAEQMGTDLSGVTLSDVNTLRSVAVGLRNASEEFDRAAADQALTPTMWAQNLNTRPLEERNAEQVWQVRFQHQVSIEGELQTVWRTLEYQGRLPATKAELLEDVGASAQWLADDYGIEQVGIGAIEISEV